MSVLTHTRARGLASVALALSVSLSVALALLAPRAAHAVPPAPSTDVDPTLPKHPPRPTPLPPAPPIHLGPGARHAEPAEAAHASAAQEHGAAHEEDENAPPKAINFSDFNDKEQPPYLAALINFALLAFIYVYFGKKPIAAALRTRRDEVKKQIDEAARIKEEAEARSEQYAAKLKDLGADREGARLSLAAAGATEKGRIVREAEEKAARMKRDAEFLLEQESKQQELDLQREAVVAALATAEAMLRSGLTPADQERVAEEFLASLSAPPRAGSARPGGAS